MKAINYFYNSGKKEAIERKFADANRLVATPLLRKNLPRKEKKKKKGMLQKGETSTVATSSLRERQSRTPPERQTPTPRPVVTSKKDHAPVEEKKTC